MNDNVQKIILNSNSNLPWYTIESKITIEARYIRQTSSFDCFAIAILKLEPYFEKQVAIFENNLKEIDIGYTILYPQKIYNRDTVNIVNTINKGIVSGIETACLDSKKKSYLIRGIKVTAISAKYHPVSRSQCYQIATHLTLLKVFNKTKLISIQ